MRSSIRILVTLTLVSLVAVLAHPGNAMTMEMMPEQDHAMHEMPQKQTFSCEMDGCQNNAPTCVDHCISESSKTTETHAIPASPQIKSLATAPSVLLTFPSILLESGHIQITSDRAPPALTFLRPIVKIE